MHYVRRQTEVIAEDNCELSKIIFVCVTRLGICFGQNRCIHDPFWIVDVKPLTQAAVGVVAALAVGFLCGPLVHQAS